MKKCILILCLCLFIACAGYAAEASVLPSGELVELFSGDQIDLDGDGTAEQISFATQTDEESGMSAYKLSVGGANVKGEGVQLNGRLYALRVEDVSDDALLLISEDGWSDDPACHLYSYCAGTLEHIGLIDVSAQEITVREDGLLGGVVRGDVLHTWYRPCDLVLCTGYDEATQSTRINGVLEMPRDLYPMGTKVTLLHDLDLCISRTNPDVAVMLKAGDTAWLVATDDIEWVYIVPDQHEWLGDEWGAGWLHLAPSGYEITTKDGLFFSSEVFDGLFFAD